MTDLPPLSPEDEEQAPPASIFESIWSWIKRAGRRGDGEISLRKSLEEVIEEHETEAEPLVAEERVLLMNLLDFGEQRVGDVAVPLADVKAVEIGINMEDLGQVFSKIMHSDRKSVV